MLVASSLVGFWDSLKDLQRDFCMYLSPLLVPTLCPSSKADQKVVVPKCKPMLFSLLMYLAILLSQNLGNEQ